MYDLSYITHFTTACRFSLSLQAISLKEMHRSKGFVRLNGVFFMKMFNFFRISSCKLAGNIV